MLLTWGITLDPGATGLTLEVQPLYGDGTPNGSVVTPVPELGEGMYLFWNTIPDDASFVVAQLAGGGARLALRAVQAVDGLSVAGGTVTVGELDGPILGDVYGRVLGDPRYGSDPVVGPGVRLDAADPALAKLALLGSVPVVFAGALDPATSVIRVIVGDSYEADTAGRVAGAWTDVGDSLLGRPIATCEWTAAGLTKTLTPDTLDGHLHVALELSATETAALVPTPPYPRWALYFTLSDGDVITWQQGTLIPKARL